MGFITPRFTDSAHGLEEAFPYSGVEAVFISQKGEYSDLIVLVFVCGGGHYLY